MEKNYDEMKQYLIENGIDPTEAKFQIKETELSDEINYWIKRIRKKPEGEWSHSDSWYELVEVCYLYKKHGTDYATKVIKKIKKNLK